MFSYSCPSCAQKLLAPPERAGQRTICPKCLKPLSIPTPSMADTDDDTSALLHAGPLVDDESPTNPTLIPQLASPPTPRAAATVPADPAPVLELTPEPPTARMPAQPLEPPTPPPAPRPTPPAAKKPKPAPPPPPAAPAKPPARVTAVVPARRASEVSGRIAFAPTGLAGADLAADLAADLTMRMKPPPEPTDDQTLTTLGWVGLTALAVVLWVAGILYEPGTLPFVCLIGLLLVGVGYLWGAYTARTTVGLLATLLAVVVVAGGLGWVVQRQVNTAWAELPSNFIPAMLLPVVSILMALPLGVLRFRPLRYIVTGELLVILFVVSPAARTGVGKLLERLQPTPTGVVVPPSGPAERVRTLAGRKTPDAVLAALVELSNPEAAKAATPEARDELGTELVKLAGPAEGRTDVRTAALTALAVWQPEATRGPVLAAVRSSDAAERRQGLTLAGRWADPEMAAAVAARLSDRLETADAQKALREIGGSTAETVLLPLLKGEDRGAALLAVMELLEAVGGTESLTALRQVERTAASPNVRDEAKLRADGLAARLKK